MNFYAMLGVAVGNAMALLLLYFPLTALAIQSQRKAKLGWRRTLGYYTIAVVVMAIANYVGMLIYPEGLKAGEHGYFSIYQAFFLPLLVSAVTILTMWSRAQKRQDSAQIGGPKERVQYPTAANHIQERPDPIVERSVAMMLSDEGIRTHFARTLSIWSTFRYKYLLTLALVLMCILPTVLWLVTSKQESAELRCAETAGSMIGKGLGSLGIQLIWRQCLEDAGLECPFPVTEERCSIVSYSRLLMH